jgi:uncharacterized protein YxjI
MAASWGSVDTFVVKEHVGLFKAASNFDAFDAATGAKVLECREPNLGAFTKMMRFTDWKRSTPFDVEVREPGGALVVRATRGWTFLRSRVAVADGAGKPLGVFVRKLLSIGGSFFVQDPSGKDIFFLEGKWTGWEFRFKQGERQLALVSKKWAGLGKEMFTSADNYVLSIDPSVPRDGDERRLILAAVMSIDLVLKE